MSTLMNPEHIFSNIWATKDGNFEKSSGEAWEVIDTDFAAELTTENRHKFKTFMASANVGESIFIEGVLILREADDFELSFDVETIPAAEFSAELKAKMKVSDGCLAGLIEDHVCECSNCQRIAGSAESDFYSLQKQQSYRY